MIRGMVARGGVVSLVAAAALSVAGPSFAQFLAPALDRPGFDRRPTQPSLRLVTLGGLSLAIPDENNQIDLWDFGGSTLGLAEDRDSTSLDIHLDSGRRSDKHTLGNTDVQLDRGSDFNLGLQAVGRRERRFAAGVDVGYLTGSHAVPADPGLYRDVSSTQPLAIPVINGRMFGGDWGWGARFTFSGEATNNDLFTTHVENGEVRLSNGEAVVPATPFDVTDAENRVSGAGFGIGWYGHPNIRIALNADRLVSHVHESFDTQRRVYETDQPQPAGEFSLTSTVHTRWLQWGGQVGRYKFSSTQQYRFSLSGGLLPRPLISRGDRLHEDFRQDWLRTRVQVDPPAVPGLLVGADFAVRYDRDIVDPATSPNNFNDFMLSLAGDTLVAAPPVGNTRRELRHWNGGAGVGYRVNPRVQIGVEGHRYNNAWDNGVDLHLRQRITDVRGGLEFGVTRAWTGRLGGYHESTDDDVYTANNEYVTNALTVGAGYAPVRSRFHHQVDGGIEYGQRSSNYPDPTETTGRVFRFVLYNRWSF